MGLFFTGQVHPICCSFPIQPDTNKGQAIRASVFKARQVLVQQGCICPSATDLDNVVVLDRTVHFAFKVSLKGDVQVARLKDDLAVDRFCGWCDPNPPRRP